MERGVTEDRPGGRRNNKTTPHPTTAYRFSEADKCLYFPCIFAPNENTNPTPPAKYLAPIRSVLYEVKEGNPDYHGTPIHAYNAPVAAHTYKCIDIHEAPRPLSTTDILGKNEDTKRTVAKTLRELYPDRRCGAEAAKQVVVTVPGFSRQFR